MSKWIEGAIKKKGAFRRWCKRRGYEKVNSECIREAIRVAKKTKDVRLLRRAVLAQTLLRLRKRK